MAKQGGQSEIGSVSVGVTADTTGLRAGMAAAKAETEQAAASIGASAEKAGQGVGKSFAEATKATNIFRQSLGRIVGTAGLVVAAINAIGVVVEYVTTVFGSGTKAAENFLNTIGEGVGKGAEARLEAIRKRIADVQSELAYKSENPNDPRGRSKKTIEDELKRLRESERATSGQIRGQQAAERAAKAKQEAAKKEEENLKLEEQIQEDIDRHWAERMAELDEKYKEMQQRDKSNEADRKRREEMAKAVGEAVEEALQRGIEKFFDQQRNYTNQAIQRIAVDVSTLTQTTLLRQPPR